MNGSTFKCSRDEPSAQTGICIIWNYFLPGLKNSGVWARYPTWYLQHPGLNLTFSNWLDSSGLMVRLQSEKDLISIWKPFSRNTDVSSSWAGQNMCVWCRTCSDTNNHPLLFIWRRDSSEITLKLLGLKSGFIFTPVYRPDCGSDPTRPDPTQPLFLDGLCSVVLTADWSWRVNVLYLLSTVSYLLEGVAESLVAVKVVMNDICGKKKKKKPIKSTSQLH